MSNAGLAAFGDREFELLLVDDGSTDRTAEIALQLCSDFSQLRVIRHGKNRGPGSAILTGIRNSRMDNICFHAAESATQFFRGGVFPASSRRPRYCDW